MRKIFLLLPAAVLFSCTNDKNQTKTVTDTVTIIKKDTVTKVGATHPNQNYNSSINPKQNLVGQWKEHWGIGVQTNVNSNDVYQIRLSDHGDINITSSNKKKYKIDQLLFDGKELSFRKQNLFYPKGKFYVYYKLKLHDDFNWMEGPITNNKKQKDYVKWEKVNSSK